MACLKLQPGTLKQCLAMEDGHPGDCIFTLLQPEVAAKEDRRKSRDNQLTRRQVAQGFIPALLRNQLGLDIEGTAGVVDNALSLADELIAKTGGYGP